MKRNPKENKKPIDSKPKVWYNKDRNKEKEISRMKINYKEVCIVTSCPFCGHAHEVEVNEMDYWNWQDGELAQNAFPYLSADERELLISGICPTCWDKMFGGYDE